MSDTTRIQAPSAREIERRFRNPAVVMTRPVIVGGIRTIKLLRRFTWVGVDVEHLDALETPVILAANHVSHADTPAILETMPRRLRRRTTVAAALDVFGGATCNNRRLWRKECLQFFVAAGFHAFAFDRYGPPLRSVRTSVDLLRNGWSLLLFPEGTRSRSGAMGPFKAGVGVLARVTGLPVIPVHVEGGRTILPHRAVMPLPGHIVVRYGAPLWAESGERPQQFADRLHDQVRTLGGLPRAADAPQADRHDPAVAATQVRKQPA